jgi:hypothetical protein
MLIERYTDCFSIVTHFGFQQSHADERVNFRLGYLNHQTAQPLPSAFPVQAHAFGGGSGTGIGCVHGFIQWRRPMSAGSPQ